MLINGMDKKLGKNVSIFGGLAGNLIDGSGTSVFDNNNRTPNGLLSLIIDNDKIEMTGFATSGWQPIATFHTITKSEGHMVSTIDEEPAMDMIAKYLGKSFEADTTEEIIYSKEASPIQLYRDNSPSVLREITYFNGKTREVHFSGPVTQGTKFRFSLPPDWDIVDKIKSDCLMVKEQKQPEADAVIIFSCSARLLSLGPMINSEIEEIKNTWECPTVGYFCFK
ncbi:MAG: FIST C-terminal domain-containing protein [Ignavibacteriales bacterium]|nr:FIST C-terminal domain-containing protein [Ignavibacteriales bacterium]